MIKSLMLTASIVLGALSLSAQTSNDKPVLSLLSDSYTAYKGYVPEEDCAIYGSKEWKKTDVKNVEEMWWWQVIDQGGYQLGENESYSGATIGYQGYDKKDFTRLCFLTRLGKMKKQPDVLLILGGTNDDWAKVPIGEHQDSAFTKNDLKQMRPAMSKMLQDAKSMFPQARIMFVLNTQMTPAYNKAIIDECEIAGIEWLQLKDIDKIGGHPSAKGMTQISAQVLEALKGPQSVEDKE